MIITMVTLIMTMIKFETVKMVNLLTMVMVIVMVMVKMINLIHVMTVTMSLVTKGANMGQGSK